ncbi:hypothetical protein Tco_0649179 [Tanacetum coccineum]
MPTVEPASAVPLAQWNRLCCRWNRPLQTRSICVKNDGESVLKEVKNGLKMILYLSEKLNRTGDSVAMEPACKSNGTGDAPMESATVHLNQEKSFVIFERFCKIWKDMM